MSIFITGDTHGDFSRFEKSRFPEQDALTKDDVVIICGDFGGGWDGGPGEQALHHGVRLGQPRELRPVGNVSRQRVAQRQGPVHPPRCLPDVRAGLQSRRKTVHHDGRRKQP